MINGIEGIPGSGKSYEAVAYHVLPALRSGRKVITNLPLNIEVFASIDPAFSDLIEIREQVAPALGFWDASDIANTPAFQLLEEGESFYYGASIPGSRDDSIFGTVWDYYTTWRDGEGRGPLFVIDECHISLPRGDTSRDVVEWFKLHRHYNVDVLLITQSFRDIDQGISRLLGTLIRCRKADILGKKGAYIRKVHGGYRGAVIQTDQRDYKPEYFRFYRSHTQGLSLEESAAQDVTPFIVRFNRFKWAVIALSAVAVTWAFWPSDEWSVFGYRKVPAAAAAEAKPAGPRWVTPEEYRQARAAAAPAIVQQDQHQEEQDTGLLANKQIHILGTFTMGERTRTQFSISDGNRRVFEVSDADLVDAGYAWRQVSDCLGWLTSGNRRRPVMCDAPNSGAGTTARPIVMDLGSGQRSDAKPLYVTR